MKAYWRVEVQLHLFFDLGTRWKWEVSFTPRSLYPQGKNPWYPLDRRLGGPHIRSESGGEEKNSQPPENLTILSDLLRRVGQLVKSSTRVYPEVSGLSR
jgi:hypothetical protein